MAANNKIALVTAVVADWAKTWQLNWPKKASM